jgi:hypothetical protein
MKRRYGIGYDWKNAPIDGAIVHAASGRRAHGR